MSNILGEENISIASVIQKENVNLDDNNQILNASSKVPYIVHQYDRLDKSLLDQISSKYEFNVWKYIKHLLKIVSG